MKFIRMSVAVVVLSLLACGEMAEDNNPDVQPNNTTNNKNNEPMMKALEIEGTWEDTFNGGMSAGELVISETNWGAMKLIDHSDEENWAITQNPSDSPFDPDKYLRIVWLEPDATGFYYCMVAFSLDTEEEARTSMAMADSSDPDNSGCGASGWSKAVPK